MKRKLVTHFDVVGSFLRPDYLKEARESFRKGEINKAQLTEVEDRAITELIGKQKEAGLVAITDGEFRRNSWHLDFMWEFGGVDHQKTKTGIPFHGEMALIDDTFLNGKVTLSSHSFVNHFRFVKRFEGEGCIARQTIPAPAQFLFQMIIPQNAESTKAIYPNEDELILDIANAYKRVIRDLYEAGCRNIQFDDCTWGVCVDPSAKFIFGTDEKGLSDIVQKLIGINNLAIEGAPEDLLITSHICRGNFHSTWACQGGYDSVAKELFAGENVDAFYLEYDDERSGGFEPLRYMNPDKNVVLGLITSKTSHLEDKEVIINRIREAAKYIPLDRLSLSPQCGFASTEEGNALSEEEQWAKLKLIKEIVAEVWG